MIQKDNILKNFDVDLLLILDCTASMEEWIESCKQKLILIISNFRKEFKQTQKIRVAFVGYRDFGHVFDQAHFKIIDYTEDLNSVIDEIKNIQAEGKGDPAEDVIGALIRAN